MLELLRSFIIINFVFRGPLGRILHSNWCHPLKIKVIIVLYHVNGNLLNYLRSGKRRFSIPRSSFSDFLFISI